MGNTPVSASLTPCNKFCLFSRRGQKFDTRLLASFLVKTTIFVHMNFQVEYELFLLICPFYFPMFVAAVPCKHVNIVRTAS